MQLEASTKICTNYALNPTFKSMLSANRVQTCNNRNLNQKSHRSTIEGHDLLNALCYNAVLWISRLETSVTATPPRFQEMFIN
ncbi:hypothetical protein Ahy_B10g106255 isoform C [Arachis hypogaea]|uniref:Uncharacterized protein n=1 Tax=Arachis hypogaea TaxID=3818 RepID=A0A444XAB2_ARAHY|nr:hypothetical protein Ahy_B10g106255 isoform C [Arachis hypogaea]